MNALLVRSLGAVGLALILLSGMAQAKVKYTTFRGESCDLSPWEGKNVVLLTPRSDLDSKTMTRLLDALDRVYEFYRDVTGREPHKLKGTTRNGRMTLAVIPSAGAASSSSPAKGKDTPQALPPWGAAGVEWTGETFRTFYERAYRQEQIDPAVFAAMGRCFWFYDDRLEYRSSDATGVVPAGYSSCMRLLALEGVNLPLGTIQAASFQEYRKAVEKLVDHYEADTSLRWENTLRVGRSPTNALELGGEELFASFLLRLRRDCGGDEFLKRFLREVMRRGAAKTTQDAIDNFVASAGIAARRDLTTRFTTQWRWPVSATVQEELRRQERVPRGSGGKNVSGAAETRRP